MADDQSCSICCQLLSSQLGVPPRCGHVFHVSCLRSWLRVKPLCPLCKNSCSADQIISLNYEPQSLVNKFVDQQGSRPTPAQRDILRQVMILRTQQRCAASTANLLALQAEINCEDEELEALTASVQAQQAINDVMEAKLKEHNDRELLPVQTEMKKKLQLQKELQNEHSLLTNHALLIRSLNNLQDELEGKKPTSSAKQLTAEFAKFGDDRGFIITWQTRFLKRKLTELTVQEQQKTQQQLDELSRRSGRLKAERASLQHSLEVISRDIAACQTETERWTRSAQRRLERGTSGDGPEEEDDPENALAQLISFADQQPTLPPFQENSSLEENSSA